ncbi:MAG: hypothetical protein LQ349_005611 [Xanthoria aureola]|nr:MAG: hypothetical protein LQ349_005611 [Xanthoria aureola]
MSTADVVAEPVNGEDVRVDLVFVHGLSDDWQSTWNSDRHSWSRDSLPNDIPHARIFTCGFNTQHGSHKDPSLSFSGLQDYEKKRDHEKRPVVFLAHGLGGLLLEAFLQRCTPPLQTATKGIVFFGTPNSIQRKDQRTRFTDAMARIGFTFEDEYLSHLGSITEGFPAWLDNRPFAGRVVCFYERLPVTDELMIVEEESAILPHCEARGLDANHMNMTKFSSVSDTNYQSVLQCLKSMYCLADDGIRVLLRHSLKASPHGRLHTLPTTPDGCEEVVVSTQGTTADRDLARLALVAEDQGHFNKAEGKYQMTLNALNRRGRCSLAIGELGHLAVAHAEGDPGAEIEKKFEKISNAFRDDQLPGPDDAAILFCVHKWACLMYGRGRYRHAELYSRYCTEARIKLYGKGSASTLLATANWISSMMSLGRYQEARNTIRDALESEDLTSLPDSVSALQVLEAFAKLAANYDYHDLAESLLCDVLRKAICLQGDEHPFTLNRMSELATILAQKGNLPCAEALSRRSLDGLEKMLGTDHPDCLRAARRLADYICLRQRYYDAILRHKQILAKQRLRIGNQHPETLLTLRSLGIDFALHGYLKDAETTLNQALSGLEACLGSNDGNTLQAASALNSLEESQERALKEGVMQTDLLEIFRPQPKSISDYEILKYTCRPSPFQTSVEGELLRAVIEGDEAAIRSILVKQTTNPQILGRALREAAASSHEPILKLLLEFDAPVNAQSGYHGSALQAASLVGSAPIVELLLEHKADISQEGGILGNALRAAVFGKHEAILSLLLGSISPGSLPQNVLNTSLQLALRTENMEMIGHLLKAGADINAEDKLFGSPLQQASFYGQEKVMTMLLEHKSDINMRGGLFASPLRAAIETQNESAIIQLLEAGAIIHSTSAERLPNRHISVNKREELAKILLNRLADSLPYRSISVASGSYDPMQISKQPVIDFIGWTGPENRVERQHDPASPSSMPMVLNQKLQPTRVSTMKRIFTFRSGDNADGPIKTQSMKKGLKRKSKRTLSQVFGRKSSMQV